MARSWLDPDTEAPRPSLRELIDSWSEMRWTQVDLHEPALDAYVDEVRRSHANGGCLVGRWRAVEYPDAAQWFVGHGYMDYYELIRTLFDSDSFRDAWPQLQVPRDLERVPAGLIHESFGPLFLDGWLTKVLVSGGAYDRFRGTWAEARSLGAAAVAALMQDRYEEFELHVSEGAWSPWFFDIACDRTFVLTDRRNAELTVICITDTD